MNFESLKLLEITLALPLVGALLLFFVKAPGVAFWWCLGFAVATLAGSVAASIQFLAVSGSVPGWLDELAIDNLSVPMLPMLAMVHLLTLLGTSKSNVSPMFCVRIFLAETISLSIVCCHSVSGMIVLLMLAVGLPAWDLASHRKRLRGFLLYMSAFIVMMFGYWVFWMPDLSKPPVGLLLVALLMRGGIVPLHGWQPSLVKNASFGTSMLFVLPLVEVLAAIRLLLPTGPAWMLDLASLICLITAVYCGGLAIVQNDVRRFYAHLCLSQTSLVLFAVMLATPSSLTAALCLWISAMISLAGLGFSIRSLEARFGELSLRQHHGYYEQVPGLAICFFCTGLAAVGFPGTVGFIPMELLISGSMEHGLWVSLTLAIATMLNALAIMRAYFALFTGKRPATSVSLQVTPIERAAIIIIALLVFLGGWFSPSVVESRHRLAEDLLQQRSQ